ncbi:rCG58827 [Rattus norvegicus]|uniref:RCG58827 n=1 Tax=Rattus norvegicus TaxID=10116 RepID=A6JL63_RAT|nr:rCG58827 [Rattus norvegicus]
MAASLERTGSLSLSSHQLPMSLGRAYVTSSLKAAMPGSWSLAGLT